ncbi:hypothetical protein BDZ89DRAFT_1060307 [Hymenopellis radicata]|nr:hypothetical protein BDZ89DRAFT_1060307 [Hymenopellis radicata]
MSSVIFNEAHLRVPELDVEFAPFHDIPFSLKVRLSCRTYLASQIQPFHVLILPC